MKQRISGLDLKLLAEELRVSLETYRLSNIYNVADASKQFLLKFGKPDSKLNVVVDSGSRIHITNFTRHTTQAPSGFVSKLRKHLKGKRLTALRQIPNDRILVLQFADGLYYLVLEFFSAGNVMLLDENRRILSLQRIVSEHENQVGESYDMFDESLFQEQADNNVIETSFSKELITSWLDEVYNQSTALANVPQVAGGKKKKKTTSIHKLLLRKQPQLSSDLLSNNLKKALINPSTPCLEFKGKEDIIVELLSSTQSEYVNLLNAKERSGYIVAKKNPHFNSEKDESSLEYVYENFHPFKPFVADNETNEWQIVQIEGAYNKTVDTFFSTIESNKFALRIQSQEAQAQKRLDDARTDNERKIQGLLNVQTSNERKAELIIENADLVEQTKAAVQSLIDQQTDWSTMDKLIQSEQRKGNKIAQYIELPLDLKKNRINLRLPLPSDDDEEDDDEVTNKESASSDEDSDSSDDSDISDLSDTDDSDAEERNIRSKRTTKLDKKIKDEKQKTLVVTIDLSLSAYANASQYFTVKKSGAEKQKKMEKNLEKAMKNIEEKVNQQLKKKMKETHKVLKEIRTPYFFEKYNWFISSEGFLVLHGKSGVESDQIYSRYIDDKDVYLSNSFDTQVWIKNPDGTEIPPNTLMQAGIFCMSASSAWSKKVSSSAWWCHANNVTKFDQQNGVLPAGTYRIKKESEINHLSPSQLVMGLAFMWKVKTEHEELVEEMSIADGDDSQDVAHDLVSDVGATENGSSMEEITQNPIEEAANDFSNVTEIREETTSSDIEDSNEDLTSVATSTVINMNKNVRGKKGKLKKMQKKYADQDDQERLLRLETLGTLKGIEKEEERKRQEAMKQEEREYKKKVRERQNNKQALKFTANEKVKVNYSVIRDELKSAISKDDEVTAVVPVFAPWPALQKYKYKVKIQPGNAKKTKSMTEVLRYFMSRKVDSQATDKEMDWPIEHTLIKGLAEGDLIPLLCVDKLNVSIPQGDKSSKKGSGSKQKSGKKGGKRK